MPTTYYKVHAGRIRVLEYWRMSPGWVSFLVAVAAKPFGGLSFPFRIPRPGELHRLDRRDVPEEAVRGLQDACDAFDEAGLTFHFFHEIVVVERDRLGVAAVHLSADGRTAGMALYGRQGDVHRVEASCASGFTDDTYGTTTTQRQQLDSNPASVVARYPELPANELFARHVEHLDEWERKRGPARRLTAETLPGFVLAGEQATVDYHIRRGVFVPLTADELRALRSEAGDDGDARVE